MLFSSLTFLCIFFPCVTLIYFLLPKKFRNIFLLIASLLFYAIGEVKYFILMLYVILISYFGGILIEKSSDNQMKLINCICFVSADLLMLFFFKYAGFVFGNLGISNIGNIYISEIVLPLGISFYTFQSISYLVDVYTGNVKSEKRFINLALYISFFPQLVAGPIIKYHDIYKQIIQRNETFTNFCAGLRRFIIGLGKKVLIANTIGEVANNIFSLTPFEIDITTAWLGAIAYTIQIYYDFSGYSDMAIGLGKMFGFSIPENFNFPYISKSVSEFWRRWHMSLSNWFKQYVYIPLGGNKNGIKRTVINLSVVFLLTGIWHGANWTFILWGVYNGIFIVLEKIGKRYHLNEKFKVPDFVKHIYLILIVVIGFTLFRVDSVSYFIDYVSVMFGKISSNNFTALWFLSEKIILIGIIAIIGATGLFKNIVTIDEKSNNILKLTRINSFCLLIFVLSVITLLSNSYNPFIYFNF